MGFYIFCKRGLQLFSTATDIVLPAVIIETVFPNEFHVVDEFGCFRVVVVSQKLFDRPQVHGLQDPVEVVHDVVFYRVDWLIKPIGSFQFPAKVHNL